MQPFVDKRPRVAETFPATDAINSEIRGLLRKAEATPSSLTDHAYAVLLEASGSDLEALCVLADAIRHDAVGDEITFVSNRNLDTTMVGRGDAASRHLVDELIDEAWVLGVTELCLQGPLPVGAPDTGYLDLVGAIATRAPGIHLHAFRPTEILDGATRLGIAPRTFLEAGKTCGLGSVPGTAALILDDGVRAGLLGRPDLPVTTWIDLIKTAHEVGLSSTATMVYGHIETPVHQVAHLRSLAAIQDQTGGFTEFIPMPLLPQNTPSHLLGMTRFGSTIRETRAVHAVARLMLHGRIDHIQAAWTKLGMALSQDVLRGGADDLGGLLVDGKICPSAGQEAGLELAIADVERLSTEIGRGTRQRSSTYGHPMPTDVMTERVAGRKRTDFSSGQRAGSSSGFDTLGS